MELLSLCGNVICALRNLTSLAVTRPYEFGHQLRVQLCRPYIGGFPAKNMKARVLLRCL